jgi:hypothetical protein
LRAVSNSTLKAGRKTSLVFTVQCSTKCSESSCRVRWQASPVGLLGKRQLVANKTRSPMQSFRFFLPATAQTFAQLSVAAELRGAQLHTFWPSGLTLLASRATSFSLSAARTIPPSLGRRRTWLASAASDCCCLGTSNNQARVCVQADWFTNWGSFGIAHDTLRDDGGTWEGAFGSDHCGLGGCGTHDTRITFAPRADEVAAYAQAMGWSRLRTATYIQAALDLMPLTR